ncbi:hypothetical protein AK812_SmicGene22960 [Symbiodinium microadriaticum]|uniref:Aminoglycoside phosphotransferase domain-containing protein n=1 Tax=Symbiodinium microadriaticum TaxID=2951 RepID=A0A1Q9DIF2_SYMMI|nr:hypothetical protein AK812_SmicGene22960 [Symbiodinium microadriaticum]
MPAVASGDHHHFDICICCFEHGTNEMLQTALSGAYESMPSAEHAKGKDLLIPRRSIGTYRTSFPRSAMGASCHKLGNAGEPQSDGRAEQHQHDSDEAADAVPGKLSPFRRSDSFRTTSPKPAPRPPKLVRGWTATEQSASSKREQNVHVETGTCREAKLAVTLVRDAWVGRGLQGAYIAVVDKDVLAASRGRQWGEELVLCPRGSEMEDDEPLDVLEFWYLWGDVPPESPPLSPQATDSDLEPSARGRLALIPSGDVERTDPDSDLEPSARGRLALIPSGNAERTDPDTGPRSCDEEKATIEIPIAKAEEIFSNRGNPPGDVVQSDSAVKEDKLAIMMANVVPEWHGIDPSRIQVQCKSGQGRLSTYKVSANGAQPPHVALHCWDEEAMEDPLSVERTGTAAELFSAHGAAPRRLAAGGDWFAEVWEGTGPELSDSVLEELGRLIADVHSWPTTWFDPFRARLKERWPFLQSVPAASHVWPSTCREENLAELSEEALAAWLRPQAFTPATKIGARAVTVHADIHMFNLLQTDDGLRIIDFEWTVVAHAAQDLATVVRVCCPKDLRQKRLFVKAYLAACAASTCNEDACKLQDR